MRYIAFTLLLVITALPNNIFCKDRLELIINKSPSKIFTQCEKNPDTRYDRQNILEQFAQILHSALPQPVQQYIGKDIVKDEQPIGFAVWDLTDTSNKDVAFLGECVDFIEDHIYHFANDLLPFSFSHIAILEKGKIRTFRSLNCPEGKEDFATLIKYLKRKLRGDKSKTEILTRVNNFRRYNYYRPTDQPYSFCKEPEIIKPNPDPLYNRWTIYQEMSSILYKSAPDNYPNALGISVLDDLGMPESRSARAINFFVYDLSDPSNKQVNSIDRVNFIDNHIYHFAYIDRQYSYSHLAVLEKGKLKVFRNVNLLDKGDKMKAVLSYLNTKLKNDKFKKEIIKRVKKYRKYGVYVS